MLFDIDYKAVGQRLIPYFLRKTRTIAFLDSIMKALEDVNNLLVTTRTDLQFKLTFNAQIIYLTEYLNQTHDPVLKRIFIEDSSVVRDTYWFRLADAQSAIYLFRDSEGAAPYYLLRHSEVVGGVDYIIHFPAAVSFDQDVVRNQVNVYNLAGRVYTIVTP